MKKFCFALSILNLKPVRLLWFGLVLFTLIVHKRHYLLIQLLKNTQTDNYEAKRCNDSTWLRVGGENKFAICFCFICKTWLACYATTFQPVGSQPHAGNVRRAEQRKLHKSFQSEKTRYGERLRDQISTTSDRDELLSSNEGGSFSACHHALKRLSFWRIFTSTQFLLIKKDIFKKTF